MASKNIKEVKDEIIEEKEEVLEVEKLIKITGETGVLERLKAQKKMPVMLPVTETMEPLMVGINGVLFAIPRGEMVEVPMSVAEIIKDSMAKTIKAKSAIKISEVK